MICAYAEEYLDDAMRNLGEAFDYASEDCHIDLDSFMELFIASGISDSFGKGNPKYVSGRSGTELVREVYIRVGKQKKFPSAAASYDYSPAYWSGWILAFYQWSTGRTFREIHRFLKISDIIKMYGVLHEAPEEKFVEAAEAIAARKECPTKLQMLRKNRSLSQKELSERAGVNLRTLQQYELGTKDINKASAQTVVALSNALGCEITDIMK